MQADWRPMREADLDAVERIARAVHVGLEERREVFAEKRRLFPRGALVLVRGGRIAGYAFSHPWCLGDAPKLDAFLGALPAAPDCLYLHDIALSSDARGGGAAAAAIARLADCAAAEGLGTMALVAVRGTDAFWAHAGFRDATDARLAAMLAPYGAEARYMTKRLTRG